VTTLRRYVLAGLGSVVCLCSGVVAARESTAEFTLEVIPSCLTLAIGDIASLEATVRDAEVVGDEPGTVEVYRVATGERMGAVDVGKQAGGIAFWKMNEF